MMETRSISSNSIQRRIKMGVVCSCLLLAAMLMGGMNCFSQTGRPFITNFAPREYASNAYATSPQNWCIGQDINGRMVIANTSGILVYNGSDWQMVKGTENKRMLKFASDNKGQIYTGGEGEIGVIGANKLGELEFKSLKHLLDTTQQDFGTIAKVVSHKDEVFFRGGKHLFKYSNGAFTSWQSEVGYKKLVSSSAGVFVSEHESWYKVNGSSLEEIASFEGQKPLSMRAVFPGENDTLIVASAKGGVYTLFDGEFEKVESDIPNVTVWNGCEVSQNRFALATDDHGVLVLDQSGRIVDVINESMGLSANTSFFPYYNDGHLWLAMNSGISSVEYPLIVSVLDKESGLNQFPIKISQFQDQLVVGTYAGGFTIEQDKHSSHGTLTPLKDDARMVFELMQFNDQLLVGNTNGVLVINSNHSITEIESGRACTAIAPTEYNSNRIVAAFRDEINFIDITKRSHDFMGKTINLPHEAYTIVGTGKELWAADEGISLIKLSDSLNNYKLITLDSTHAFVDEMGIVEVSMVGDNVLFGTEIGVYYFDHSIMKLKPFKGFGKRFSDGSTGAYNLTETRNGDVWVTTDRQTGLLRKQSNGSFMYDSLPLMRTPISDVWDIYEANDGIVWVCGTEAIVRYDPSVEFDYRAPYNSFIRNVVINDKKEIFSGNYADKNGVLVRKQPNSSIPTLNYDQNNVTFQFGAAIYTKDSKLEFSVKLEGKDTEWSSWKTSGQMSYNNLPEGRYTFKVRARNVYGTISEEASYTFEILPPWYRTTWAYILFVAGGIGLLFLLLKLNSVRLRRENVKLEGVISDRTAEVRQQKERAEQSEAFKQQFLANMSHEIRTPMNAVMGMTNLVLNTPLQPKQKNYMEGIKKSSDNLLHIINDILDLSKIEAGKMELEAIDFSLSDTINQVNQTLQHRATDKGLELLVSIDPRVHDIVLGDPVRLNQVLINLTGNAIKFTEQGSVAIQVTNVEEGVKFAIIDTGVGIPKDKMQAVFESFSQANASDTRKFGGTGLGLSISRQLVELMGGRISVESEVGLGTTFSFVVELEKGSEEALEKRMAMEHDVDGTILDGLKILVTDDNEFNRIVARDTLKENADLEIIEAENGLEAVEILKKQDIDVILMDVQMPVMNGYESTRTIRKLEGPKKDVPIIALTASVLRTDLDKCTKAGMNAYIPKPFKRHDIIAGIADVLNIELRSKKTIEETKVAVETSSSEATDLAYLTNFCKGDRTKMKKYIDMFLKGTEKLETQIGEALENEDTESLANQVHGFNTKFVMMGMKETKSLSVTIENSCRGGGTIDDVREMVELLLTHVRTAVEELGQFEAK